uniref:Amino acid transporter transmembrane domain-containing protein n=1 Tax=Araucaria cunninghamii TaxID=56994 RepID=A0A0D6QV17_ARACU
MGSLPDRAYPVFGMLWSCCGMHPAGRSDSKVHIYHISSRWVNETVRICHLLWRADADPGPDAILSFFEAHKSGVLYSVLGIQSVRSGGFHSCSTTSKVFAALNAFSIIATTYGNGIIPEIQATLAPPVSGKMFKGLCVCYSVVMSTFFSVAISGYWAFGNKAAGTIYSNFVPLDRPALLPNWFLFMSNMFVLLQLSAVALVYLQPAFEVLERQSADVKMGRFSVRNLVPRLILRTLTIVIATLVAAMLPFFGDINAVIGAFGFLPLDFVLPMVCYNLTFKPSKRSIIFWANITIAVIFSMMSIVGCVAAVRQISLDADSYKLFANV